MLSVNLKIPKKEKMIKLNKLTASISLYAIGILFSLNVFAAEPLVSVGWLSDNLVNDKVVILDIRNKIDGGSKEIFETGHIPSSVYSNYLSDGWRTTVDGIVGKLPPLKDLEILIGSLGIGNDNHVVVVPGGINSSDFGSAARVYWTFKVLGHEEVSILDGGYTAWVKKFPGNIESGIQDPNKVTFKSNFQSRYLATTEEVFQNLDNTFVAFVDARSEEQHFGKKKHGKALAAGTIPGAILLKQSDLIINNTSYVKDLDSIIELAQNVSIEADKNNIVFCNTGHWAATTWFVLSEVLGLPNVKNYDGSMVEWTADVTRPLENTI